MYPPVPGLWIIQIKLDFGLIRILDCASLHHPWPRCNRRQMYPRTPIGYTRIHVGYSTRRIVARVFTGNAGRGELSLRIFLTAQCH